MGNRRYIVTQAHLNDAKTSANIAYWVNDDFHVTSARESLVRALSGMDGVDGHNAELKEIITVAIEDSFDVDWKPTDAAQGVIDAILDACLPMIKEDAGE